MTPELLLKCFFLGIISCALAWAVFDSHERELNDDGDGPQRYLPVIPAMLLPVMLDVLVLLALPQYGVKRTAEMLLSYGFGIFLHISLYYLLLIPLMPLLRKWISARACALLWIIPNYLYIVAHGEMSASEPLLVIRVERRVLWAVLAIWFVGFAVVMLWKTAEHLIFRRRILRNAKPMTDPVTLDIWQRELESARINKPKFRLVESPDVETPLSVGVFQRTTRVVLPQRRYTPEELTLILRHELIHVCREDGANKYFLLFCGAVCWFNPLMWLAMRRSGEDLELSCDETVLLEADEDTRRAYAQLILRTAGENRGFTSNLSASAATLRYRLRHIVKPRRRRSGALVAATVFFWMALSCGFTALAYDSTPAEQVIFEGADPATFTVTSVNITRDETRYARVKSDEAMTEYLSGLSVSRLTGNYSFSDTEVKMTIIMQGEKGAVGVNLWDRRLTVVPLYEDGKSAEYYMDQPVDWDYVESLLEISYK